MSRIAASITATILSLAGAGCTRWDTTRVDTTYGPQQEVGRRLLGAPMVEEVTSHGVGASAAGAAASAGGSSVAVGGVSAGVTSVKRKHCVQQAQIDYTQTAYDTPTRTGRGADLGMSIPLLAVGLLALATVHQSYTNEVYNWESGFSSHMPETPTTGYAISGGLAAAGGAWLIYSVGFLPDEPKPVLPPRQKTWTETTYVQAQGCGLVPGDQ